MAKATSKKKSKTTAKAKSASSEASGAKKKATGQSASSKQKVLKSSVASKTTAKKKATSKAAASKAPTAKKTAAKKVAAKKVAAKKAPADAEETVAKKTTTKKTAAKKTASKKPASKKVAAKKVAAKSSTAKTKKEADIEPVVEKKVKKKTGAKSASSIAVGEQVEATVVPYEREKNNHYMDPTQLEHFSLKLAEWKQQLMEEVDRTVGHMKDDATNFPDPNDRATQEEEFSLELRTRDRERKLIKKINEAQKRIEENEYGYCETCGVEIGVGRLEARPTAELCIDCKTLEEIREKQIA